MSNIKLIPICAGYYSTDAGASMGVMPRALWEKSIEVDAKHRQRIRINLLLIVTPNHKVIIDTGIGNKLPEKLKKIYAYSDYEMFHSLKDAGYSREDITDVILTHLHFDHAGGVVSVIDGKEQLTFPNATHWTQEAEWLIARNPDALNKAAYDFERDLSLLEEKGKMSLVKGDSELFDGIRVIKVGGHTEGFQIVEIDNEDIQAIWAGDIIPTQHHLIPPIISAYDISRKDSFKAKEYILKKGYTIYFSHDPELWSK